MSVKPVIAINDTEHKLATSHRWENVIRDYRGNYIFSCCKCSHFRKCDYTGNIISDNKDEVDCNE